jgi:hypothetical protein
MNVVKCTYLILFYRLRFGAIDHAIGFKGQSLNKKKLN